MTTTSNKPRARSVAGINIRQNNRPIGFSGLNQRNGQVQEEPFRGLRSFNDRMAYYREASNDVVISTLVDAIKLPLLAAEFTVSPGSEEAADLELKEFIEANLFSMVRQTWRNHVLEMLYALEYGFSLAEIVLEKRSDGLLYIKNLEPRGQETLERWEFDNEGKLEGFVQRDPASNSLSEIPIDKLVHVTFRGRKGNPEGQSLLRSLYWPYVYKRRLEEFESIGIERDVGGMPVATMKEPAVLTDEQAETLDLALENMRRNTTAFIRLPFGVELDSYRGSQDDYIGDVINRKKMEIFQRGFAQFLTLGTDQVGTQALVQGDIDFFHLGLISIQQEFTEAWNQQLIPYVLFANGYDLDAINLPTIHWSDPGAVRIKDFMEAYKLGTESGLFDAEPEDVDYARTIMDLPASSRTEGEANPNPNAPSNIRAQDQAMAEQQMQQAAANRNNNNGNNA